MYAIEMFGITKYQEKEKTMGTVDMFKKLWVWFLEVLGNIMLLVFLSISI